MYDGVKTVFSMNGVWKTGRIDAEERDLLTPCAGRDSEWVKDLKTNNETSSRAPLNSEVASPSVAEVHEESRFEGSRGLTLLSARQRAGSRGLRCT